MTVARWPWFTIVIAFLAFSNPLGIAILRSAIERSPTDWLSYFWQMVVVGAIVAVAVLGLVEWLVRRRMARRGIADAYPSAAAIAGDKNEGATRG